MKLTKNWFKENNACKNGYEWVCDQFNHDDRGGGGNFEIEAVDLIQKLIDEEWLDWANWTICRVFSKQQKVKYAVFAAEQVINIFEEKYPDDKRPRQAIEAAKKYIENPSKENASAAASAARSASAESSGSAASAAALAALAALAELAAASAAARSASAESSGRAASSGSAALAAESAAASASRAAWVAESAAILNYGLQLLAESEEK